MENRQPGEAEASQESREKKPETSGEDRETRESEPSLPLAEAESMRALSSTVGSKLKKIGERGPRAIDDRAKSRLQKGMGRFRSKVAAVAAALGALVAAGPIGERLTGDGQEETAQAATTETTKNAVFESPLDKKEELELSAEENAAFLKSLTEADKAIAEASSSLIPTGLEGENPDPFAMVPEEPAKPSLQDARDFQQHAFDNLVKESQLGGKNLAAGLLERTGGLAGMNSDQIHVLADEAAAKYAKENGMSELEAYNGLLDELKRTATGQAKAELSYGAEKMKEYANLGATNKAVDAFNGMIRNDMMDRNSDEYQSTSFDRGLLYDSLDTQAGMQDFEDAFKKFNSGEKAHVLQSLDEYTKRTSSFREENGEQIEDVELSEFLKRLREFIKRQTPK